jgi:hypothetical protein
MELMEEISAECKGYRGQLEILSILSMKYLIKMSIRWIKIFAREYTLVI